MHSLHITNSVAQYIAQYVDQYVPADLHRGKTAPPTPGFISASGAVRSFLSVNLEEDLAQEKPRLHLNIIIVHNGGSDTHIP